MIRGLVELVARAWRGLITAAPARVWAIILGAPPLTAVVVWLSNIVWRGPWRPEMQAKQLDILGWALQEVIVLLAVIIVALAAVKLKANAPGGASLELDGDHDDEPPAST